MKRERERNEKQTIDRERIIVGKRDKKGREKRETDNR